MAYYGICSRNVILPTEQFDADSATFNVGQEIYTLLNNTVKNRDVYVCTYVFHVSYYWRPSSLFIPSKKMFNIVFLLYIFKICKSNKV